MTRTLDEAYGALVAAWRRHDDLRHGGASLSELLGAKLELDSRRVAMAHLRRNEGR